MVTVTIAKKQYQVCTKWSEVDPDKLLAADDSPLKEIAALSDIPLDLLIHVESLPLLTLTSFIDNQADIALEAVSIETLKVEFEAYQKMEYAKELMKTGKLYSKLLKVAMIYYPDCKNSVHLISHGLNIIDQIQVFLENYKEMYEAKLTPEQELAGYGRLSDFGAWGTAYTLAGGDFTKVGHVLNSPAIEVYTALFFNNIQSKAQKAYLDLTTKQ